MKNEFFKLTNDITFRRSDIDAIAHKINYANNLSEENKIAIKRRLRGEFKFISAVINTPANEKISDLINLIFYNSHEVTREAYAKELTVLAKVCQDGEYYVYDSFCYHNIKDFVIGVLNKDLHISKDEGRILQELYTLANTTEKEWYYQKYDIEDSYENRKVYNYVDAAAYYDHNINVLNFMKEITWLEHTIPTKIIQSLEAIFSIEQIVYEFDKGGVEAIVKKHFHFLEK